MSKVHAFSSVKNFSRRDFLKLGGLGVLGLFLAPNLPSSTHQAFSQADPLTFGRVLEDKIASYRTPTFQGQTLNYYWRDSLLPIHGVTLAEDDSYNRIWYLVGEEEYVYSGMIQPVQTHLNQPISEIPESGLLAEVTVPYTDAYWGPGKEYQFAYRFYYETTCWILGLVSDQRGGPWYSVWEDKWDLVHYIPATHLRIVPIEELALITPQVPPEARRLEVWLDKQVLIAYEWDQPVFTARVATGAHFSTGNYETPLGRYMIDHKCPSRHMAAGDIASNGYDLPGVPWVSYFTEEGVSLHGTYWHNDFGKKRSHGCINLTPQAAKWVYLWTQPNVPPGEKRFYGKTGTFLDILK